MDCYPLTDVPGLAGLYTCTLLCYPFIEGPTGGMLVLADRFGRRKRGVVQQIGAEGMVQSVLLGQSVASTCLLLFLMLESCD